MNDIENREDIIFLINSFYDKLLSESKIGFFFTDVAKIDLPAHLPVLYNFWESVVFGTNIYQGNVLQKHLELHNLHALESSHFKEWLGYFITTIDLYFKGKNAERAKQRALSIATVIQIKIADINN